MGDTAKPIFHGGFILTEPSLGILAALTIVHDTRINIKKTLMSPRVPNSGIDIPYFSLMET